MAQLSDGLRHTHQQGMLHCDIKPSNILIGVEGQPLLPDFNLSEAYDEDTARHDL